MKDPFPKAERVSSGIDDPSAFTSSGIDDPSTFTSSGIDDPSAFNPSGIDDPSAFTSPLHDSSTALSTRVKTTGPSQSALQTARGWRRTLERWMQWAANRFTQSFVTVHLYTDQLKEKAVATKSKKRWGLKTAADTATRSTRVEKVA